MRLEGLFPRESLKGMLRVVSRDHDQISVPIRQHEQYLEQGWTTVRVGQNKVTLQKERPLDKRLELLVWRVLYDMGFPVLSGDDGVLIHHSSGPHNQVDVVAHDQEIAVVVECKASGSTRRLDMQAELALLALKRNSVRTVLNEGKSGSSRLKVAGVLVVQNVQLTDADFERAKAEKITILDYETISYYGKLSKLIGSASRYQLLGELFAGQEIPNVKLKVPAVESRMGEYTVYTFSITPAELLRIAYVAHRARNDFGSYQRMVNPRRLVRIREYIDDNGVFPTNIVINFNRSGGRGTGLLFEPGARDPEVTEGSKLGYLTIPGRYQSAWIIDGQHRLLSYADHRWATRSTLTVTAFDGLDPSTQADLFVKINSEQKKVPAGQLEALFATLNWNADDPRLQVRAIVSQVIQDMRSSSGSVLGSRILMPDEDRTERRCITLKAMADSLKRAGMFIKSETNGVVRQYGILWDGAPERTLHRVKSILETFFSSVAERAPDQWELGSAPGGVASTNLGVGASIRVLAELLEMVRTSSVDAVSMSTVELSARAAEYGSLVGDYFSGLAEAEVTSLRALYGNSGPPELAFRIADYLTSRIPEFKYPELDKWRNDQAATNASETKRLVDIVERRVKNHIIATLKGAYGEDGWWRQVPAKIRADAAGRREMEGEDHPLETFLMVTDYREIVQSNWTLFDTTMAIPPTGSKESRTKWFVRWNDIRNRSFHSSGARLKPEDYREMFELERSLAQNDV